MSTKRRKRHSPEQIVTKFRDADAMLNAVRHDHELVQAAMLQRLDEPLDVRQEIGRSRRVPLDGDSR
jgi:hypothetical protein